MASAWSAVVIGLDSLIAQREKETPQPYEERHYPVMYWARPKFLLRLSGSCLF
jgi:hypothetical protein